jgi:hypothetical protein
MLRAILRSGVVCGFGAVVATWLLAGTAWADETYFRTPSGNIHCAFMEFDGEAFIRCDIRDYTASFRKPADCDLDYGGAFEISPKAKRGAVLCAGDTVMNPEAGELGYGEGFEQGGLSCQSETSGITCSNESGHGFFVSRAKQKVF